MDSSELFQKGPKPTDPNPKKPAVVENPDDLNQPVSVRKSHLSPRGNEFDRNRDETEPVEPVIPIVNDPDPEPEVLTINEMLEMEDEELLSYGIDNPKTWKSYQRLLHKKEAEWSKERNELNGTISDLQKTSSGREERPSVQPSSEQNAPLVKPVKPQRPVRYDATEALTDPASESARYMNAMDIYREEKDVYQDGIIANLTGYVANDQQSKLQLKKREQVKSQSLSRFQTRGLSAKDATQLYEKIEQAYMSDADTGADIFVDLFKGGNSNGSELVNSKIPLGKRKLPDNIFIPPGVNTSTAKPVESKSKSFMQGIQGANQTRKIILNRTK